ncbi:hypothetical protein CRUP_024977 [Coryphaenoides rupestris]|nr:hypothetical protein CRUP_024977 [Coryphaenoides rupestris]
MCECLRVVVLVVVVMSAVKALEKWCQTQCRGYSDVAIDNMTTSFRNGMAFCALIHKYRPDLIDYDSLKKEDVFQNNHLAFRIAEEKLGIPALLDAEDMVALRIPDRLSILTYVSQYYNYFNGRSTPGGVKRPAEGAKEKPSKKNLPVVSKTFVSKTATETAVASTTETSPRTTSAAAAAAAEKTAATARNAGNGKSGTLNSKCVSCKSHVHLVERHLVDGRLYHRSCFRCSECSGTLHAGAYRLGEVADTFVCKSHHRDKQQQQTATKTSDAKTLWSRVSGHAASPRDPPTLSNGLHHHHHVASNARPTPAARPIPGAGHQTRPAPRPASILLTPVTSGTTSVSKPVDRPAPTPSPPLSLSAQRTQAARQRFFQAVGAVAVAGGPAGKGSAAPDVPPAHVPAAGRSGGPTDKSLARATIVNKLSQENHNNNNNTTSQFTVRSAKRRLDGLSGVAFQAEGRQNGSRTTIRKRFSRRDDGSAGEDDDDATRRHVPTEQIERELDDIEAALAVLEQEGVELEKKLRSCEEDAGGDVLMDPVMVDWFKLIGRKQTYIRKESELVYTAQIQELESQQPGVEGELRSLLDKPDHLKSRADRERERGLMARLVEIVNGRNAIVDVLDEERLRLYSVL